MLKRVLSSIILWSLVLGLVFSKFTAGTFLLISCIGLFAQWEFYTMQERRGFKLFKKAGLTFGGLLFAFSYLYHGRSLGTMDVWISFEVILILIVILGALARQVFEKEQTNASVTIGLTLLGFFYVPYLFNFVFKILFWAGTSEGFFLIVYLVAVTKLTDAGAYLAGTFAGKHPMSPHISPKKTWEGFVGGILLAMISSITLVKVLPIEVIRGYDSVALGLFLGFVSVIGDLGESLIKRDTQSKDSGDLIPGIGGALDLIDSILFTAPMFYAYLTIFV